MRSLLTSQHLETSLKTRLLGSSALVLTSAFLLAAAPLDAETLYYDNDGNAGAPIGTVDGIWDVFGDHWNDAADGSSNNEKFKNNPGDDVIFGTNGVKVDVRSAVRPDSITFDVTGYVIREDGSAANSQIVIGNMGNLEIDVTNSGDVAQISATISTKGFDNRSITVNSTGDGILRLAGDNSEAVGTLFLQGGQLTNLGDYGGEVDVNGGLFLAQGGEIKDVVTVDGGELRLLGGTFSTTGGDGQIDLDSGLVSVMHGNDPANAVDVNVDGGELLIVSGNTLTGDITQTGGVVNNVGTYVGTASVQDGIFTNIGDVTGGIDVSGTGQLNVNNGTINGTITNADTGIITLSGGTITAVENDEGTTNLDGAVSAAITNGTDSTSGTLNILGTGVVTGSVTNEGGTTTNDGEVIGTVTVNGGTFDNNTTITGTASLTGGTLNANLGSTITGLVTNGGGDINTLGGNFDTGILNNSGTVDVTVNTTAPVTNAGGFVTIANGITLSGAYGSTDGTTNNSGTIADAVTLSGGTINNFGLIDDTVTVSGTGDLVNSSLGEIAGLVTVNGGSVGDDGGTFTGGIVANGGTVNILVNSSTDIVNEGGHVNVDFGSTWTHDYVSNKGSTDLNHVLIGNVMLSGDATDAIDDIFTNSGIVDGDVNVDGSGVFNALVGSSITGKLTLDGGTVNVDDASFSAEILNQGGALNIRDSATADVRNTAGLLTIENGQTLTGYVDNVGGNMNNLGTLTGPLLIDGGSVESTGDFNSTVRLEDGAFDANGGVVTGQTTVLGGQLNAGGTEFAGGLRGQGGTIIVDGDTTAALTNVGSAVTVQTGNTLTGVVLNNSGTIDNQGTIDGTVTINGGSVTTSGTMADVVRVNAGGALETTDGTLEGDVINAGGDITASGGEFDAQFRTNSGTTTVDGAIIVPTLINAGGTVDITTDGIVDGAVSNVAGTTTQTGEVTGQVTVQAGTYNANGTVGLDVVNNGGDVNVDGLVSTGTLRNNTGTVTVAGTGQATMINESTLNIDTTGRWNGEITHNNGLASNSGVVVQDVRVRDGTWTQEDGSRTVGVTTLTGGTLTADGGSFIGGITANGGTLLITDDTVGDIRNNGINFTIGSARTVTGDVTNNSGNISLNGKVFGDVRVSDGTVTSGPNSRVIGSSIISGTGTFNMNGGVVTGDTRVNAGNVNILADASANIRNIAGTVAVNAGATLNGTLIQTGGTSTNNGELSKAVTISGGTLTNDGVISGTLKVAGAGTVDHESGASLTGVVNVTGGDLNLNGGDVTRTINNNGGTLNLNDDTTADVINRSGDFFINAGQTVDGLVKNLAAGYTRLDGTIDGNFVNSGLVDYFGDVTGTLTNTGTINTDPADARAKATARSSTQAFTLSGPTSNIGAIDNTFSGTLTLDDRNFVAGIVTNQGEINISNGFALASRSTADFSGTSSLTINDGTLAGEISFANGATVDLTDATLEGTVTANTLITTDGTTQLIEGSFPGSTDPIGDGSIAFGATGQLQVNGDLFEISGDLTTNAASVLTVADGATLAAENLTSNGTLTLGAGATLRAGTLGTNTGTATFGDGSMVEGAFRNTGLIIGSGSLTFGDGLRGGGRVNLARNATTGDEVNIGGALGAQTFNLDIDLSGTVGTADQIVMSAGSFVTGDVVLNFNVLGAGGEQVDDVVVLDAANGQGTIDAIANGLPDATDLTLTDGIIVYGLTQNDDGDLVVFDALDQGISSIAGTIVLAQSLIGSVINRPSSPFVSGLAFEDENPCGAGIWARAIGGSADATGQIEQINGTTEPFDSSISADYYGVQIGGDYACFNGFYDGWDLAFGAIGGVNIGTSNQPIFAPDTSQDSGLSDVQTSVTDVDFTQAYGGVYVAAVRDRLAVDLQYRIEKTDYTATNVSASGGASLGLEDETFSSEGQTLSGAVSYSIPVKDTDLTFVPTVGFAYSKISTDPINFVGRGVVQIDDFDSQIGFVGGTLTRTKVGADGVSALTQFGTLTVYNDFAENPTSTFTRADNGDVTEISSENLGTYGEISAGLNYVKILQPGEFGAVKQFNASVRGDIRVSDRLESWGLTAQARFQF